MSQAEESCPEVQIRAIERKGALYSAASPTSHHCRHGETCGYVCEEPSSQPRRGWSQNCGTSPGESSAGQARVAVQGYQVYIPRLASSRAHPHGRERRGDPISSPPFPPLLCDGAGPGRGFRPLEYPRLPPFIRSPRPLIRPRPRPSRASFGGGRLLRGRRRGGRGSGLTAGRSTRGGKVNVRWRRFFHPLPSFLFPSSRPGGEGIGEQRGTHTAPQEPHVLVEPLAAAPHLGHEACIVGDERRRGRRVRRGLEERL